MKSDDAGGFTIEKTMKPGRRYVIHREPGRVLETIR